MGMFGVLLKGHWPRPTMMWSPLVTRVLRLPCSLGGMAAGADLPGEHLGDIRPLRQPWRSPSTVTMA